MKKLMLILVFLTVVFSVTSCHRARPNKDAGLGTTKAVTQNPRIGASFTISHAMWLNGSWGGPFGDDKAVGPVWQDSLKEIANSGVSVIRLSHPWDLVEPEQGKFNWQELDEAVEICEKAGVEIVLCFGVKSPRHPEYHPPAWIKSEVEQRLKPKDPIDLPHIEAIKKELDQLKQEAKTDPSLTARLKALESFLEPFKTVMAATPKARDAIAKYITQGVRRYRDRAAVVAWQIENEPLMFTRSMALSQVKQEIESVKKLDIKKRPVLMTTWTAVDVPEEFTRGWSPAVKQIIPLGGIIGFDCYVRSHKFETQDGHWTLIKQWVDQTRKAGKKVWIAEWQAETWEQDQKMDFKNPDGNASFNPKQYEASLTRARQLGADKILLWGLEFQIACKNQGNDAWWDATLKVLREFDGDPGSGSVF